MGLSILEHGPSQKLKGDASIFFACINPQHRGKLVPSSPELSVVSRFVVNVYAQFLWFSWYRICGGLWSLLGRKSSRVGLLKGK